MIRAALPALACLALSLPAAAPGPKTVPERSGFAATSTVAEVRAFMEALRAKAPRLVPYRPKGASAATEAGKPILAWRLPSRGKSALRVYLNANIHGGEV